MFGTFYSPKITSKRSKKPPRLSLVGCKNAQNFGLVWIPPIRGIHTNLSVRLGAICMDTLHQRYPYQSDFSCFHALVPPWSNVMLPDFFQSTFNQFAAVRRDGTWSCGCLITPGFTGGLCELET